MDEPGPAEPAAAPGDDATAEAAAPATSADTPADVAAEQTGLVDRAKADVEKWRGRAIDTYKHLEEQRSQSIVIGTAFGTYEVDRDSGGTLLAGAVAYRLFLVLVPYTFVLVLGIGYGADMAEVDPHDVARSMGITGLVATAFDTGADLSGWTRFFTFMVALFALVYGARNLAKAIWIVHLLIWRLPAMKLRRPGLMGLAYIGAFTVCVALERVVSLLKQRSLIAFVFADILFVALPALAWWWISVRWLPKARDADWTEMWPGALLMGIGLLVTHLVTVLWITHLLQSKSEAYGAIGAALAIMFWAYIVGRLFTASASLNAGLYRNVHPAERAS